MDTDGLPLSQALSSLRQELYQAVDDAQTENLRFKVEAIEVELQVVATRSAGGSAGIGLWQVVQLGGKLDREHAATHRVKLTLLPTLATGSDTYVGDEVAERPR